MSDPSEPRQPPRPPQFNPPDTTSEFPPVGYGNPYTPPPYDPPPYDTTNAYPPVTGTGYPPPPPGYGPPPGYPPQGYPQPGYGPPPRPPRKSAAPLVALVLAVTLLLCGGVVFAGKILVNRATDKAEELAAPILEPTLPALPSEGTDWPQIPGLPTGLPTDLPTDLPGLGLGAEISVTYEVTGDGPAEIIYIEDGSNPTRVGSAELPWKVTATMKSPALVSVVALRSGLGDGKISCRASVGGKPVAEHSAEGTLATATCSNFVIE